MPPDPPDALLDIPVEDISPDPDNTRPVVGDDDLRALGTSMLTQGQEQPITVRPNPPAADGRRTYTIRAGHRRWMAAKLVGKRSLKAIVVATPQAAGHITLSRMAENRARKGLTPIQDVNAVAKAKRENEGMTNRELADRTAYSESEISKCLAIFDCPVASAALADGRLGELSVAYGVAIALPERKEGLIVMRMNGASRDAVLKAAKATAEKPDADPPPRKASRVSIPLPKVKAALSVTADVSTLDGLLAVLLEGAELVRKSIREGVSLNTAKRAWADRAKKAEGTP